MRDVCLNRKHVAVSIVKKHHFIEVLCCLQEWERGFIAAKLCFVERSHALTEVLETSPVGHRSGACVEPQRNNCLIGIEVRSCDVTESGPAAAGENNCFVAATQKN